MSAPKICLKITLVMSGHSKWKTIKRDKGANDAKRGQVFTKLGKAITIAAKKSGPDPNANPYLKKAIEDARASNMPKDNVERAIAKAVGGGPGEQLEEVTLEGYGPSGVAFMVSAVTDNRNRTLSEVRGVFNRHGGSLGQPGSAAYIFGSDPNNPSFSISVEALENAKKVLALVGELEDLDDIQKVFANFDITDALLSQLS